MRLHPDGFLGAVVASESLGMTDTMINGAGGCRSRSQIVTVQYPRWISPSKRAIEVR